MQEKYKLSGFINMFNVIPDFIFPVFEKKGIFFFETGDETTLKLEEFIEVKQSCIDKIVFISNFKTNLSGEVEISLGSAPIFGFQVSEDYIFIGDFEEIKKFLMSYETDDEILKKQIEEFLNNAGTS